MDYIIKRVLIFLRRYCYRFIQKTGATFIYQIADNIKFDRLGRKPPELIWRALPRSARQRYDTGGIQLKNKLYIIGGFCKEAPHIVKTMNIFDLERNHWADEIAMPSTMAQSHLAITSDASHYLFIIGGQCGPHCSPATKECFVVDVKTHAFTSLPDLPEERFSLNAQFWHGRIHVGGGSKPDRYTATKDHWSIAIEDGKATESTWQVEPSFPRGGPHRANLIINDTWYVFGGQEGDVVPVPGDPEYRPAFELSEDTIYPDVYALKYGAKVWERKADMPVWLSHTEFSTVCIDGKAVIVGGQTKRFNNPLRCMVTDVVQVYDPEKNVWKLFL